jgi:methionyl-tRNA formyltransferase
LTGEAAAPIRLGRICFLGTGRFGLPLLAAIAPRADALLVVTQPDRPAGRGLQPGATPVARFARERGLDLATPGRLRSEAGRSAIGAFAPDGLLLAAYGQLIPADLLSIAPRQPLNVHPSLLPRHRGAAPVAGTILAGDNAGGVSLMIMVPQLDAGPVVARWPVQLTGREEAPELEERLARLAAEVVPPLLDRWGAGEELPAQPQDERKATIVRPFRREDGRIDWRRDAIIIDRQVRALQPWPGAWTTLGDRRLHIRRARPVPGFAAVPAGALLPGDPPRVACGLDSLELIEVQPEGRARMPAESWRRGLQRDHVLLGVA